MNKEQKTIKELCNENDALQAKIKVLEEVLKEKTNECLELEKLLFESQNNLQQLAFNFANTVFIRELNKITNDEFVVTINNKKFIELVTQIRERIK